MLEPKTIYSYRGADGTHLYDVVRLTGKRFFQQLPDGTPGRNGTQPVLYRLPELLAAPPDAMRFIAEGEKDVETLCGLGLVATCNLGGAGKWQAEFAEAFRSRNVVIVPDNDGPGLAHAEDVAKSLFLTAASVKVAWLAGLPAKGDVTDWIAQGHTREELLRVVSETPEWTRDAEAEQPPGYSSGWHTTDCGNAQRLAARHGKDIRFCNRTGWLMWDGARWQRDERGEMEARAKETAKSIYQEAANDEHDGRRRILAQWAAKSESDPRIRAMLHLAQSEPSLPVTTVELDADAWLLNCANGTVDLRTGELQPHQRQDLLTKRCNVAFDPDATCPRFLDFLAEVFVDAHLIEYMQRVLGYAVTGDTREQVLHVMYGTGANGKTTLLEVIRHVLGDYATQTDFSVFLAGKSNAVSNDVARLNGVRFCSSVEIESGRRLNEVLLKVLTGGDTVTARFLYHEHFEFKPSLKLFLACNHRPAVRGTDHAIWRRIRLLPFTVTFPPDQQDRELPAKLRDEASGILTWLVQGCARWQRDGLTPPDRVAAATAAYRAEQDVLGDFLTECCDLDPCAKVTAKELYSAYVSWCAESKGHQLSQTAFGLRLSDRGLDRQRSGSNGKIEWHGLRLK